MVVKVNGEEIKFGRFPNGELLMDVESFPLSLENSKYIVMDFKYTEDADLIKLMFVKKYIHKSYKVILRIWQMPYQRMDRSEHGSPFSLKYISDFINQLDFYMIEVIEPHSDVTLALLEDSIPRYINFNLINEVIKLTNFNEEEDFIMFPDNGAASRYNSMKFNNVLIGHKDRDFQTGKIRKLDILGNSENTEGKRVIICDDLSSFGGTFVYSSHELRKLGFTHVYLLVAHAENSIFEKNLFDNMNKVFTTDSMLTEHENENVMELYKDKLKVFKIEDIL